MVTDFGSYKVADGDEDILQWMRTHNFLMGKSDYNEERETSIHDTDTASSGKASSDGESEPSGLMDYLFDDDFEMDKAFQYYLKLPTDFYSNPKDIMVKEFSGRDLFEVCVDDGVSSAHDVKQLIVHKIDFLADEKDAGKTLGLDDFKLSGLDDEDIISEDYVKVVLLLRGGAKSTPATKKAAHKVSVLKNKVAVSHKEVSTVDDLIVTFKNRLQNFVTTETNTTKALDDQLGSLDLHSLNEMLAELNKP